jgi:hypothetical protein
MARGKSKSRLELRQACYERLEATQPASVRSVAYYLFNVLGLIPSMEKKYVDRVGDEIRQAREDGEIPWEWVVDDSRQLEDHPSWSDPEAFIESVIPQYRLDYWEHQPYAVEVWSEKSTVSGTLRPVLRRYGVGYRSMHGFTSATKVHDIVELTWSLDKPLRVLYVGDFDPSGLHMSEVDITRRLEEYGAEAFTITRVALTRADTLVLTSFPVSDKRKDPRYPWFVRNYGDRCWELDAMDPNLLRGKVDVAIRGLLDVAAWNVCKQAEAAQVETFRTVLTAMKRHVGANPI